MPLPALPFATAYILASLSACSPQPSPDFHFNYRAAEPVFINSKSAEVLGRTPPSFSHVSRKEFPVTGGFTDGQVTGSYEIRFKMLFSPRAATYCLWADSVGVNITYKATVSIASEFHPGSCRYRVTRGHEMRHVTTDIVAMEEFMPKVQASAAAETHKMRVAGPLNRGGMEAEKQNYVTRLQNAVQAELDKVAAVRQTRQEFIDTPAEYRRTSDACPDEPLPHVSRPGR